MANWTVALPLLHVGVTVTPVEPQLPLPEGSSLNRQKLLVTDVVFIASLKVIPTSVLVPMLVAPDVGLVLTIVGGVVSGVALEEVVKVVVEDAVSALPAESVAAVPMLTVYVVLVDRELVGSKVSVLP